MGIQISKHKEVKRWAAGQTGWDDQIIVVQATLVETDKTFRLKVQKDRTLSAAERQFSACLCYYKQWHKDSYPTVGYATRDGALRGYLKHLREQLEKAEAMVRARSSSVVNMEEQMMNKSFKEIK